MTNENKYAVVDVYILELHLSPPVVGQVCLNWIGHTSKDVMENLFYHKLWRRKFSSKPLYCGCYHFEIWKILNVLKVNIYI